MSKQSETNVTVIYDEDLIDEEQESLSPQQKFVISEFKQYKIDSLSVTPTNFVAPNEGIQESEPSVHALFGRDRVFEHPSDMINDIHKENLSHVHYSDNQWAPEMNQWDCTSNLAVVYSGFILEGDKYHFVVHELLINEDNHPEFDAHDYYGREDLDYYLENAAYYRKAIESDQD